MCLAYKIFLPTHQAAVHQCFNSKYLKELYGRASIIICAGTKKNLNRTTSLQVIGKCERRMSYIIAAVSQSRRKVSSGVILACTRVRTDFKDSLVECQAPASIVFLESVGTDLSSNQGNLKNACIIDFKSHPE